MPENSAVLPALKGTLLPLQTVKTNIGSAGFRQTGNKAGVERMKPGNNDLYCRVA